MKGEFFGYLLVPESVFGVGMPNSFTVPLIIFLTPSFLYSWWVNFEEDMMGQVKEER